MSPVFATQRRAEEFNSLVESSTGALDGTRYADILALVEQLRDLEPPAPRPDFTLALREQLMAAADTVLLPAPERSPDTARLALPPRRTARDRRIAAAVGAAAIIGASTSVAVAAQSALPGEMLYPVKRLIENAQTEAHLSEAGKGASMLSNAADRLAEVTELSRTSDLDEASTIADTLTAFSEQSLAASDLLLDDFEQTGDRSSVEELNDFTVSSMETLAQLEAVLPPGTREELRFAAEVLGQIDAAASRACPSCRGGLEQIPPALLAGQFAEPTVTYVSPPLVEDDSAADGGQKPGSKDDDTNGGSTGDGYGDSDPLDPPELPASGDGPTVDDPTGPLDDIVGGLTGQGGEQTAGGGDSGGVVEDTVDAVEDVIDSIDDPLLP
jgi:hypothetical protein